MRRVNPENILRVYFQEINQYPRLSVDEEWNLAKARINGDKTAKDTLIKCNLRLVVSIARGYLNRGLVFLDLIQEGNLGLLRAAEDYDDKFKARFATYASYWIKQSIRLAIMNGSTTIRLPTWIIKLQSKWNNAERELTNRLGCPPTFGQIITALGLDEKKDAKTIKTLLQSMNIHYENPDSATQQLEEELIEDLSGPSCALEYVETCDELRRNLARLQKKRSKGVEYLTLIYGLNGEQPQDSQLLAAKLHVSHQTVNATQRRALQDLRTMYKRSVS